MERNATDRISTLPQPIIHDHIFRFLPNKDIKVTTSLSKTWYHICNSFPQLDFDNHGFGQDEDKYLNYVGQTLQRFHNHSHTSGGLETIRLLNISLIFRPRVVPLLDRWIALVLQHGVEDLNIKISNPKVQNVNRPYYDLPPAIFDAKSMIKVATFTGCSLLQSFPSSNNTSANFHMRKLCLKKVHLDQATLSCIISGCPLIEELSISDCMGNLNCLRISNLQKLKALTICSWNHITFEIDAPSLHSLEIQGPFVKMSILSSCPILTDLHVKHVYELDEIELQDILSRLPFLCRLWLVNVYALAKLRISSDTLNKLTIFGWENLVELHIDAPNLLSIIYKGPFAPLIACSSDLTNVSSAQWYVSTSFYGPFIVYPFRSVEDFLFDLRNFVSKIKQVEYFDLRFDEIQNINLWELKRRVVHPPVANIENLKLCVPKINDYFNCFLDGVLWSFRPRSLSMQLMMGNTDYVVNICSVIMLHRGGCCCCSPTRSNWLHCLDDVVYVTKDGTENRLPMDGALVRYICSWNDEIKFIFKW